VTTTQYDLVIVGAGIQGAGIAQAASAQGYSVLILEQNEIAAGTSSRSSKLIHGGLRYLESGQFSLVRECLAERATLLKLAPELIKLKPFYFPIYKHSKRWPWQLYCGLTLYKMLGFFKKEVGFKKVPKSKWKDLDGLNTEELKAVYQYWDAQTDDRALTKAVVASALELGSTLHMPATLQHADITTEGVNVEYHFQGNIHRCTAKILVNAAGPWCNEVIRKVLPVSPKLQVDLVQGTHILVNGLINEPMGDHIFYLESPSDRRPVFVMPWGKQIMVGTTETPFHGVADDVVPLTEEKTYLLEVLSYYFPKFRLANTARTDSAFAGLRVLPTNPGSIHSRTRDTLLHLDNPKQPRLLTVYGGKLTAYRITAERVVKQLKKHLPPRQRKAVVTDIKLTANPVINISQ